MATKLHFDVFRKSIDDRSFPMEKLGEYVELDPESPVPKLKIIPDALLDSAPEDYNIDREIYKISREKEEEEYNQIEVFKFSGKQRIVAEGDSWFNLPPVIRPKAIADRMKSNGNYKVKNIAYWGHTIETMYSQKEYLEEIDRDRTDYFMLSGGGNDLQNGLENEENSIIKQYDSDLQLDDYLTNKGDEIFNNIENKYRGILTEITSNFPIIMTFCHGYDYPRPLVDGGKYIGQYLSRKNIPDDLMAPIMAEIIDKLNSVVSRVAQEYGDSVNYVNCRTVTEPYTWRDDMHPGSDGFKALAKKFESDIGTHA